MSTSRTRQAYVLTGMLDDAVKGSPPRQAPSGRRRPAPHRVEAPAGHLFPDEMGALAASLDDATRESGVVPMWS